MYNFKKNKSTYFKQRYSSTGKNIIGFARDVKVLSQVLVHAVFDCPIDRYCPALMLLSPQPEVSLVCLFIQGILVFEEAGLLEGALYVVALEVKCASFNSRTACMGLYNNPTQI